MAKTLARRSGTRLPVLKDSDGHGLVAGLHCGWTLRAPRTLRASWRAAAFRWCCIWACLQVRARRETMPPFQIIALKCRTIAPEEQWRNAAQRWRG